MEDEKKSQCGLCHGAREHGLATKMLAIFLMVVSVFYIVRIKNEWNGYDRARAPATISVFGEGKEFVKPDIATISVGVVKQNVDLLKAQKEAADVIDRTIAVLREKGVTDKDQKTTSFNIYPQYDYRDGAQKFRAYEVRQTLEVKIRDLSKVGEVFGDRFGPDLAALPNVTVHRVWRPLDRHVLGSPLLSRTGQRVWRRLRSSSARRHR